MELRAFHNDEKIKEIYVNRVKEHEKLDEIEKGYYWEDGKGCAVGCTLHSDNHEDYEKELGIPKILAHLEDRIFENLPNELAKTWPLRFLQSIKVGADLSKVWPNFAIFLLTDPTQCNSRNKQCVIVSDAYKKELNGENVDWHNIIKNAYAASRAAAGAYAAYAAAAASRDAAADAAYAAAADAAYAAAADAAAYIKQSEKLLDLLLECK